ncbi:hypothetical protein ABIA16_004624 [Sinorhizobium fredii]
MKALVTFCQKTGRRLRLYLNRQVAKLSHTGQLKISVAYFDRREADHEFWFRVFAHLKGIPLSDSKH